MKIKNELLLEIKEELETRISISNSRTNRKNHAKKGLLTCESIELALHTAQLNLLTFKKLEKLFHVGENIPWNEKTLVEASKERGGIDDYGGSQQHKLTNLIKILREQIILLTKIQDEVFIQRCHQEK